MGKNYTNTISLLSSYKENSTLFACYFPTMTSLKGVWIGGLPFSYTAPLFVFQIILIVLTTRFVHFLLRQFHVPRYVSEIIAGIILGPSAMGRSQSFNEIVFPLRSLVVLDVFAHLGLIFFAFSIGVEIDLDAVKRTGVGKSFAFAGACLFSSFSVGSLSSIGVYFSQVEEKNDPIAFFLFLGVALSINTFSILASTLAELKLVGTDVGRLTLSSAIVNNGCMWVIFIISIVLAESNGDKFVALMTAITWLAFSVTTEKVLHPLVAWVLGKTAEGEDVKDVHIRWFLVGVLFWAYISDCIGLHAIYGAFLYGVMIPNGPLGQALVEKVENFMSGLLMPLFFLISGLRTDLFSLRNPRAIAFLVLASVACAVVKVAGGAAMAAMYEMPVHDGVSLGLLMNTKGVNELLVLNIARNKMVMGDEEFTVLIIMLVLIAAIVNPVLNSVVKPSRRVASYKRQTIQWPNPEAELRLLLCIQSPRQVAALLALLDVAYPTKRSPFFIFVLHLIELAGRVSNMIVVNYTTCSSSYSLAGGNSSAKPQQHHHFHNNNNNNNSRLRAQSDHIFHAFENYEQHTGGVSVLFLTSISSYATMDEDIVSAAEDKHAAVIVLPFHKQQTVDGGMQVYHPSLRSLNQNVLASAPCTVAILIDRGLANSHPTIRVMLLFFGGPDDRESLALASRMAGHPDVRLTVHRFVYTPKSPSAASNISGGGGFFSMKHERVVNLTVDEDREQWMDNQCLDDFNARWGRGFADMEETTVSNAEETVEMIRELGGKQELFIVGKSPGSGPERASPLMAGLTEWSECPELGPIGDLLASTDFGTTASVLVVQQGGLTAAASARNSNASLISNDLRLPEKTIQLNKVADYNTTYMMSNSSSACSPARFI